MPGGQGAQVAGRSRATRAPVGRRWGRTPPDRYSAPRPAIGPQLRGPPGIGPGGGPTSPSLAAGATAPAPGPPAPPIGRRRGLGSAMFGYPPPPRGLTLDSVRAPQRAPAGRAPAPPRPASAKFLELAGPVSLGSCAARSLPRSAVGPTCGPARPLGPHAMDRASGARR